MVRELRTCFVLLWKSVLISMELNIFICYKRGMIKFIRSYFQRVPGETTQRNLMRM